MHRRVRAVEPQKATKVFAIASGEDGLGKTSIVANLAFALTKLQKTVLVMDADLGLGNLTILPGLTAQYTEADMVFRKLQRVNQRLLDIEISPRGGLSRHTRAESCATTENRCRQVSQCPSSRAFL
jgi:Mrp family chromosome partitioning ATPase